MKSQLNYFRMKKEEIKLKLTVYTYLNAAIANSHDIITIATTLFDELKGSSADEIKDLFFDSLAKIIHDEAEKERLSNGD